MNFNDLKSETLIDPRACNVIESLTLVRPYYIYNDINLLLQVIPHVALEVQTCSFGTCSQETFGKADNSKIYSPDILTVGRACDQNQDKCRKINPGYNKANITDWIKVNDSDSLEKVLLSEYTKPSPYSLFFNNCASFVSGILNSIGIEFNCKVGFIDFPLWCN